jgi:hypothetical protein
MVSDIMLSGVMQGAVVQSVVAPSKQWKQLLIFFDVFCTLIVCFEQKVLNVRNFQQFVSFILKFIDC